MSTRGLAIYCLRRMGGNDTLLYVLCNSSTKSTPNTFLCFFCLLSLFLYLFTTPVDPGCATSLCAASHFLFCFDMHNVQFRATSTTDISYVFFVCDDIDEKKIGRMGGFLVYWMGRGDWVQRSRGNKWE